VFDMFILFDEIDLVEARMHELDSVVDVFVVAEANATHQTNERPKYAPPQPMHC
jgi:beta-1,4-mannosyl-glycoprotein beta-1,4-N-acetylglucosaminyltransferase